YQWHTPAAIKHTEDSIFSRHAQITPERNFESSGDRIALDCGNDRFGEQHPRDAQWPISVFAHKQCPCAISDSFEIEARTECPSASAQYSDRQCIIAVKITQRLGQCRCRWSIDSIPHFWSIDRDNKSCSTPLCHYLPIIVCVHIVGHRKL